MGESLNLSTPEQFKPSSPFVFVRYITNINLHKHLYVQNLFYRISQSTPIAYKSTKLSTNTLPDNPRCRVKIKLSKGLFYYAINQHKYSVTSLILIFKIQICKHFITSVNHFPPPLEFISFTIFSFDFTQFY